MSVTPVVTIDGPAASGKSSVSRELARRMGWSWVSTGAFYRGLAYVALQESADFKSEDALAKLALSDVWSVQMTPEKTKVLFRGKDVTDEIGKEQVGVLASQVSQFPAIRKALLGAQRHCAVGVSGLVAEGRDCGTVVFPQAQAKIYLTARSEDRAARRAKEEGRSVTETYDAQKQRDAQDAGRKAAPLQIPADAHVIDTSELNLDDVVNQVESFVKTAISADH